MNFSIIFHQISTLMESILCTLCFILFYWKLFLMFTLQQLVYLSDLKKEKALMSLNLKIESSWKTTVPLWLVQKIDLI